MAAIENINGQAITLALKHKDKRDPKSWKGFKFAVPFDFSMHNYLLRYYLAEAGLDPDTDVQIRAVPPPEMVANLRADNIDGFLAPDPVNQRAVYRRRRLHPRAVQGHMGRTSLLRLREQGFVSSTPNTYAALLTRIIEATAYATKAENRKEIAEAMRRPITNQPAMVVEQVLTGTFADGLGNVENGARPHRLRSIPLGELRGVDPLADEALGAAQGRCRLPGGRQARSSSPPTRRG